MWSADPPSWTGPLTVMYVMLLRTTRRERGWGRKEGGTTGGVFLRSQVRIYKYLRDLSLFLYFFFFFFFFLCGGGVCVCVCLSSLQASAGTEFQVQLSAEYPYFGSFSERFLLLIFARKTHIYHHHHPPPPPHSSFSRYWLSPGSFFSVVEGLSPGIFEPSFLPSFQKPDFNPGRKEEGEVQAVLWDETLLLI